MPKIIVGIPVAETPCLLVTADRITSGSNAPVCQDTLKQVFEEMGVDPKEQAMCFRWIFTNMPTCDMQI